MITDHIFAWAEKAPDREALRYNGHSISYEGLARQIALARGYFARRGYGGPGIAILAVQNIAHFWFLSLALRSLGLTTIAIARAEGVAQPGLRDVRCVVTTTAEEWPALPDRCAAAGFPLLRAWLNGETELPLEAMQPQAPGGHLLQTSGTTGTSKKLLIDPATEDEYHHARRAVLGIDEETVFQLFSFAPWTGAGYKTPMTVWAAGGGVIFHQVEPLHEALLEPGATHGVLVPNMLAPILAAPEGSYPRNERMQLSLTGGTVTAAQIEETRRRISPILYNRLSSTEVGIFGFTRLEEPDDHRWHRLVPGRRVEIVDQGGRPVPTGQTGLLRIATDGGPTGYFNNPGASRAFFRGGFFYTGDLATFRSDGRVGLQGRVNDVINLSGSKISPAPIEDRLREALGLSGICLVSMQNDRGEEQIHVVVEAPAPLAGDALTQLIERELGAADRVISYVAELPRTGTGKVMRGAVRELVRSMSARQG